MTLRHRNPYRALAIVAVVVALATGVSGAAMAGQLASAVMTTSEEVSSVGKGRAPIILADASNLGGGAHMSTWPLSMDGEKVRPPAEKDNPDVETGLASAAIIRPLKNKNLSLAVTAGTPGAGKSSPPYARQTLFKRSHSNSQAIYRNDTIEWVVLTGTDSIGGRAIQIESDSTGQGEGSWYYSVEMIFVPMASLAVHAALSVDPGEDAFHTGELDHAFDQSRIGVSIGLDFRPKEGVILDVDYARLMKHREALSLSGSVAASGFKDDEGPSSGDDVISVSLSIQF